MELAQVSRNSKLGSLITLRNQGFHPAVVIDVGAQTGTNALYQAFPDAIHLMIEPVVENEAALMLIASRLRDATVVIAAAGATSGETYLHVSPNTRYSSISSSAEPAGNRRDVRTIACISVDDLCQRRSLGGPFLIKIDVDGKELDVLTGCVESLKDTECAIVETVFFGDGTNNFYRVVEFMNKLGFVIYDIVELLYRPLDSALWQVDTVFVKRDGPYRQVKGYADPATMKRIAGA